MKKTMFVSVFVVACTLFGVVNSIGQTVELRASGIYYLPSGSATTGGEETYFQDVEWDKGTGFELQAAFFPTNSAWGVGVSIGMSTWDIKNYKFSFYENSYQATFADTLEGDADLTIFGLSAFWTLPKALLSDKLNVSAEAGVRYITVDSNINGKTGVFGRYNSVVWDQTLEIDDSIIGLIAIGIDYAFTDNISLFAQAGFHFDIDNGKVKNVMKEPQWNTTFKAGETEFQNVHGKVGIAFSF